MKSHLFTSLLLLICVFFGHLVTAQNTMYFMDRMPQSIQYNPAVIPNMKFYIGLPGISGISVDAYNSGFNYNELKQFADNLGNDSYNPDEFVNSIGDVNHFTNDNKVNILSFGFRMSDKSFLSFQYVMNTSVSMDAESKIAYLLADYDNITDDEFPIVIDGIDMKMNTYTKMGFSYAHKINEHLTLGISPNIHFNAMGLQTENLSYKITMEEDPDGFKEYNSSISGSVNLGLPVEINPNAVNGDEIDLEEGIFPEGWSNDLRAGDFYRNATLSLDLGATYQLEKWMFSASLLNLGNSKWKQFGYTLTGSNDVIKIKDTLVKYAIPVSLYLGASRQFVPKWNYAVLFNSNFYQGGARLASTVSLNGVVGSALSTSISYTAGYDFNNLGIGLRLRFLPGTDLYFVTDNIIQAFSYKKAQRLTAALGINIAIGVKEGLVDEFEELNNEETFE